MNIIEMYRRELLAAKRNVQTYANTGEKEYWEGYIDALYALRHPLSQISELQNDLDHIENIIDNLGMYGVAKRPITMER